MSTMKNGFSTLNRWLGRKNKDKSVSASNGKLSKSNNNLSLSISTIDINETSQLEYNRITPQPAATSNAPFEQTFRITVLLPKDQLYVARLGALVPLSKLLELVCGNKLLSTDKYEFRNPVDASQVFDLNLSIGAVGLSEVRLCLKSDPYDSFNTDDVVKLRQSSGTRDSCSSSEISSRQSKHTTKTISPYSSSNSLNSLESSSVHYAKVSASSTPMAVSSPKILAPPRKKRVAPRPPSQTTIHEQTVLSNGCNEPTKIKSPEIILSKKDYYVSTPDLPVALKVPESNHNNDINNMNNKNTNQVIQNKDAFDANELYARVEKKNVRNLYGGSVQNLTSLQKKNLPEPSPRKHIVVLKKKSAPAPPSRGGNPFEIEDDISLSPSICETPVLEEHNFEQKKPTPASRETQEVVTQLVTVNNVTETSNYKEEQEKALPKPVPRVNTFTTNDTTIAQTNVSNNVSKVMLNRTPTPEPRSLCSDVGDMDNMSSSQLSESKQHSSCDDDDNVSKQADSGIGEPVPSPVPDSLPSEGGSSAHEFKSTFESSSDDDEMIRVYNFKLGKTVTQPLDELDTTPKTNVATVKSEVEIRSGESTPATIVSQSTPCPSETASWNFCIPISPPPNFADNKANKELLNLEKTPDVPITPKIKERPVLDFESLSSETQTATEISSQQAEKVSHKGLEKQASYHSASSPLDEIVDELSAIIQQKGVGSLIKKAELPQEIESAKPKTLENFSIVNISQQSKVKPQSETGKIEKSPVSTPEEEKLYRKQSSVTVQSTRKSIIRADSFNTAADVDAQPTTKFNGGLNSRSSSYSTLTKLETNGNMGSRGKSSSSELSIAESPSLQSLEIIKTILNSRKNSLANSSSDGEDKTDKSEGQSDSIKPKTQGERSKPLPKVYRYSGPPSINLGTWNERPKASVSIKNEGDYIFGGKNASNQNAAVSKVELRINVKTPPAQPQSQRASVPAFLAQQRSTENMRSPPAVPAKPNSPIKRMGIPDDVYRVPITVKPLKDVVVDNHEVNASTLPRSKIHQQSGSAMSMALKRSSSITALEAAKVNKQAEDEKVQVEAPFGQSTLRKTGFKERILSLTEQPKNAESKSENRNIGETNQKNFKASVRKQEPSTPRHFNRPMSQNQPTLHVNYQAKPFIAPKSAPKSAPAAPIPPPPPSFQRTIKHNSINNISTSDPRDQLLDAIRNFKFDQLNRSNSQK